MLPLQEADRAEAVYAATEKELRTLEKSNEVYGEVLAEYAHYGNGYLNEEESKLPDRRMMLDSLKSQIFPLTAVSSISITSDQMSLEGTIPNGTLFPQLVRDAEADPNARYVTASLEETVKKDGEERALASLKQVGVSMAVFFERTRRGQRKIEFVREYVLQKAQKIVLLVVVFALIAGGYYAGFYLPVQRRIEAADTAELDAQIQLEQMKAMQIRQMEEEIEENKTSNAPMVPAYNHFKTETEELNRIFANAYDFTFQYSEPQVDGMEIRRAMNISFTADSFDHAVSMLHEVVEGSYRCLIEDLSIQDDEDLEDEELKDIRIHPVAVTFQLTYFETRYDAESEEGLDLEPEETQAPSGLANADVSNLQRSDLETAAEAALGE